MAQPSIKVELLVPDTIGSNQIVQASNGGVAPYGRPTGTVKLGQTFKFTKNTLINKITVELAKTGSPTDAVQLKIFETDKSTLIGIALNTVIGSTLPTQPTTQSEDFNFDIVFLFLANTEYFIEFSRTGSNDNANFYYVGTSTSDVYANGDAYVWNGSAWSIITSPIRDIVFTIFGKTKDVIETIDISNDVNEIPNINTGLNGVYGTIKQGEALLIIDNHDSKYSPLNVDSELFEKFVLNNLIKITATFSAIDYILFTGTIQNIDPLMGYSERSVEVRALDLFSRFKKITVSIGAQSGKTASELIVLLLVAAGFVPADYDIQTDPEVLKDVTWNDVNLIDKLNEIVEAGQHYHFIDGDGVYVFRNNQFLSSDIPLFTYDETDPDSAKQSFNIDDIRNLVEVEYGASLFSESKNVDSIFVFDERRETIDNDLIIRLTYAEFIGDYVLELKKDAGNIIDFDLSLTYPDIFKIEFGDTMQITEPFHGIDNVYNAMEKTIQILRNKNILAKIKGRKFTFPPQVDLTVLEPFTDDALIVLSATVVFFLQGFKPVVDSKLHSMTYKLQMTVIRTFNLHLELYELDVNGFPTGSLLATSNNVSFTEIGLFDGIVKFNFSESEKPTIVTTKTYGAFVDTLTAQGDFSSMKIRGSITDVYANGKPAQKPVVGPWTTLHPNDFYFKAIFDAT